MLTTITGLFFSLLTSLLIIVADYSIKVAAEGTGHVTSRPMLLGIALYVISALLWFVTMRHIPLGQAAVAYSMFSLIGLFVLGVVGFGESAEWRDFVGIAMALAAMALMLRWL